MKYLSIILLIVTFLGCSKNENSDKVETCNQSAKLIFEHTLSPNADSYLASFINNNDIIFENIDNKNERWHWKKSKQKLNLYNSQYFSINCENDNSLLTDAYVRKQYTKIEYLDIKNDQTFTLRLGGLFGTLNKFSVDINEALGELLELKRSFNNSSAGHHIINYFITEEVNYTDYKCAPGSEFYESYKIGKITLENVITMDVPGENDHYKVYINKDYGIVLLEELATNKLWKNSKAKFEGE